MTDWSTPEAWRTPEAQALVRDVVARTTAEQGVPFHIEDPIALDLIAEAIDPGPLTSPQGNARRAA